MFENRILGCLYGQAIGDALGFASEAMTKEEMNNAYPTGITRYSDRIEDEKRKDWPEGFWTDDTEMLLLILDSIIENKTVNVVKIAKSFLEWYDEVGYQCCGALTRKVLNFAPPLYEKDPIAISKMVWELKGRNNASNGGLMRTAIVGLFPTDVENNAIKICQMTHYDSRCVASCVIASKIIYNLVWNNTESSINQIIDWGLQYDEEIVKWIELAYNSDSISSLELDEINSMAYTYRTLSAALWTYWHAKSFEDGLLKVETQIRMVQLHAQFWAQNLDIILYQSITLKISITKRFSVRK